MRVGVGVGVLALCVGNLGQAASADGQPAVDGASATVTAGSYRCLPLPPEYGAGPPWGCVWASESIAHQQVGVSKAAPFTGERLTIEGSVTGDPSSLTRAAMRASIVVEGLVLRFSPTRGAVLRCEVSDPFGKVPVRCVATGGATGSDGPIAGASAIEVTTDETIIGSGRQLSLSIPVVAATAGTGAVRLVGNWSSAEGPDGSPHTVAPAVVAAEVAVTVKDSRQLGGAYRLPASLRSFSRVRSQTPATCAITKKGTVRVYRVKSHGVCRMKGTNPRTGRSRTAAIIV